MDKNITEQSFWALGQDKAVSYLETTHMGLSENEAQNRLKLFGKNIFDDGNGITKLSVLLNQFKSPLIFILIIATAVTLFLQDWVDSAVITLAIIVNTALGFYQENRAQEALDKLKTYIKERVRIFRNGTEKEIPAESIVPGDILHLNSGNRISADALIIEAHSLSVDESILTGESLPVAKDVAIFPKITEPSNPALKAI